MEDVYICYEWKLMVCVLNRKGKKYPGTSIDVLGCSYEEAKEAMLRAVKKKRWKFLHVVSILHVKVAFAFYCRKGYPHVPRDQRDQLPKPAIPEEL